VQTSVNSIQGYYTRMIDEATVGASGAVFGLLFAFGYLFPNTELYLMFIPIPIKAKWFVAGYALVELYLGIANSAGDNVAHFAHLGGLLFAFIMLRIWKKKVRDHFY
jgi:membrane associated rhomboid family serine protease